MRSVPGCPDTRRTPVDVEPCLYDDMDHVWREEWRHCRTCSSHAIVVCPMCGQIIDLGIQPDPRTVAPE